MADRPLLFSAPMVRALLAGRKTQTRRTLAPQPEWLPEDENISAGWAWKGLMAWPDVAAFAEAAADFAPYAVGDRLWVREEYYQRGHWWQDDADLTKGGKPKWKFAPYNHDILFDQENCFLRSRSRANPSEIFRYKRLGRFMPRRYSRLTLTVTDVSVERLQDISEADAIAEGVFRDPAKGFWVPGVEHPNRDFPWLSRPTAREMYAALWDTINGSGAWLANPWVVAVTFTVEQRNIDA